MLPTIMRSPKLTPFDSLRLAALVVLALLGAACSPDGGAPAPDAQPADDPDAALADELYPQEAYWPVRVWLEEPLLGPDGDVLVKPKRNGVLVYLQPNGEARVDFGRYGAHTVPVAQTNFSSELERVRSGAATKTHPNLLGMLVTRLVDASQDRLMKKDLRVDEVRGGRVLLVFADAAQADVAALTAFAESVEAAGDVRLTTFIPITEELDGDVLIDLRAGGWSDPFLMTPMSPAYTQAMLEPGTPTPFARLATDEGRILAEGVPDDATQAAMIEALQPHAG
jgi:hypothetical protein